MLAPVVLQRSNIDPEVWVPIHGGYDDLTSFLHAGRLRRVMRYAESHWDVDRWTRDGIDCWNGWTPTEPSKETT